MVERILLLHLESDEMFDTLTGNTIFSSVDLLQGFHKIPSSEKSKEYIAFTAGSLGFISINVCPFGLCYATATFQRTMKMVLKDSLRVMCLVFIDDVIVHSVTECQYLKKLDAIFTRQQDHGLWFKPS